jgi:hypothetical protein
MGTINDRFQLEAHQFARRSLGEMPTFPERRAAYTCASHYVRAVTVARTSEATPARPKGRRVEGSKGRLELATTSRKSIQLARHSLGQMTTFPERGRSARVPRMRKLVLAKD